MAYPENLICKTVLSSLDASPLLHWCVHLRTGKVLRVSDEELPGMAVELKADNGTRNFISLPKDPSQTMGMKLPILALFIKDVGKDLIIEVQILDSSNIRRRMRACSFINEPKINPFVAKVPLKLESGDWNQVQLDLKDMTELCFGTLYMETTHMQIHANCRLRQVFFANRMFETSELPEDVKFTTDRDIELEDVVKRSEKERREKVRKSALEALKNMDNFVPQRKSALILNKSQNTNSPLVSPKRTAMQTTQVRTVHRTHKQETSYDGPSTSKRAPLERRTASPPKSQKMPVPSAKSAKQAEPQPISAKQTVSPPKSIYSRFHAPIRSVSRQPLHKRPL